MCVPGSDPVPIDVSADGEVDEGAPALPVSAPAPVEVEPAAGESPAEGVVSRGGAATVLGAVPSGEVLTMPVADDGRVSMSAAVKESSPALPKMSLTAVVAARFSMAEITGWVTVATEVITG
jgi:hypothetical protein